MIISKKRFNEEIEKAIAVAKSEWEKEHLVKSIDNRFSDVADDIFNLQNTVGDIMTEIVSIRDSIDKLNKKNPKKKILVEGE